MEGRFFAEAFGRVSGCIYTLFRGGTNAEEGAWGEWAAMVSGGGDKLFFKIHFHEEDGAGRPFFLPCPIGPKPLEWLSVPIRFPNLL